MRRLAYLLVGICCLLLNYSLEGIAVQHHFYLYHNLPNFLSVFIAAALIDSFYQEFRPINVLGVTIGLIFYEVLQVFIPARTFDTMDIVMTLAGMITYLVLNSLFSPKSRRQRRHIKEQQKTRTRRVF